MATKVTEPVSALTEAYIQGLRACAVYVVGSDERRLARAGWSNDPARTLSRVLRSTSMARLDADLIFVASEAGAVLLLEATVDALRLAGEKKSGRWWCRDTRALMTAVCATAETVGVPVVSRQQIEEQAAAVATKIATQFEAMRRAGALSEINAAYRAYRVARSCAGETAMSYAAWLDQHKLRAAQNVAAHARNSFASTVNFQLAAR